jgi:hypothetical protein
MKVVAQCPCFREAWKVPGFEYDCYEEFQDFAADRLLPHAVPSGQTGHTGAPSGSGADPATSAGSSAKPQPGPAPTTRTEFIQGGTGAFVPAGQRAIAA